MVYHDYRLCKMEQDLNFLYTSHLRGDLDLLPRLYTFLAGLQRRRAGRTLKVDAGYACDVSAWHCAQTGGRSALLVLDATSNVPLTAKAPLALGIMAGIVLIASLRIAPVAIAAICGVLVMVTTGCLKWRHATRSLDSSMILLTVASLALSLALVTTGGAAFIAQVAAAVAKALPPLAVLSMTMLFMAMMSTLFASEWSFSYINVLTQGGPFNTTTNIYYLLWTYGFQSFNIGASSAAAVVFFLGFGVLAWLFMKLSRKLSFFDN